MEQDGSILEVGAEYQLSDTAVSMIAGYRHTEALFDPTDAWGIGLRWNFGDATLLKRDHAGARLNRPGGVVETFAGGITLE